MYGAHPHQTQQPTLLLVEDNTLIAEFVIAHLEREQFRVLAAENCSEGLELLRLHRPDLIVLDVLLEDGTGYEFCRTVRAGGPDGSLIQLVDVPILMLTAKADEVDRLEGFRAGADDYVTKPFSPEELVCRIQAILRRSNGVSSATLAYGPLYIDPRRHEVLLDGAPVTLTPKEFELLHTLAANPGRTFSREYLLDRVWGYSFLGNTRTVDVHVNRLRQKLAVDPRCGELIATEWGVGYKFVIPPESSVEGLSDEPILSLTVGK